MNKSSLITIALVQFTICLSVSCSSSEPDSTVPISLPKTARILAISDNEAKNNPFYLYQIDAYAPCNVYYLADVFGGDGPGSSIPEKIEMSVDSGEWIDVTSSYPVWKQYSFETENVPRNDLQGINFSEPGSHYIDLRVSFANGDVLDSVIQQSNPQRFTINIHDPSEAVW